MKTILLINKEEASHLNLRNRMLNNRDFLLASIRSSLGNVRFQPILALLAFSNVLPKNIFIHHINYALFGANPWPSFDLMKSLLHSSIGRFFCCYFLVFLYSFLHSPIMFERQGRGQVNGRMVEHKSRSANICRANFLRETKNPGPS